MQITMFNTNSSRKKLKLNFKAASFSYMFLKTELVLLHSAKNN